ELIEQVRYRPVTARYKIYIIDEVHMLSKQAFNALLKTLEEPPEHVKFIFATTEIRRVPVTVLSRCQRFDLRRVEFDLLAAHLADVAKREGASLSPAALALIARAADGSVRDGLSLLDTAIAHGLSAGAPSDKAEIGEDTVREMLGLADRGRVVDLFENVMRGEIAPALALLRDMYASGADPAVVLQDLLEYCHLITRLKVVPGAASGPELTEAERARGRDMADKLTMASLTRGWQMLLKGLGEVTVSASPLAAAEMALVRLAYAAELPAPAELVRRLAADQPSSQPSTQPSSQPSSGPAPRSAGQFDGGNKGSSERHDERDQPRASRMGAVPQMRRGAAVSPAVSPGDEPAPQTEEAAYPAEAEISAPSLPDPRTVPDPKSFEEVVALFETHREAILHAHLVADVHLVRFEPGRIEFRPGNHAPANLANRLGDLLGKWTARRWVVSVSHEEGALTLKQQADRKEAKLREEVSSDPTVRAILEGFPGATITAVRETPAAEAYEDEPDSGDQTP
ncbi:MAG: DNA polymerase III subunit gamma/tau, partial [Alphaproteobacteria bacterium]